MENIATKSGKIATKLETLRLNLERLTFTSYFLIKSVEI